MDKFKTTDQGEALSVSTAGAVFADGALELVKENDSSELSLFSACGEKSEIASVIQRTGQTYLPVALAPSLAAGIRFPSGCKPYESTRKLFAKLSDVIGKYAGLSGESAHLISYFVFATFFVDCFQTAPFLTVIGAAELGRRVLRLLGCLCYHGLLLADVKAGGLLSLPRKLAVTLLIDQPDLSAATKRLLRSSQSRRFGILQGGELRDIYHAKAIYIGEDFGNSDVLEGAVEIHIPPASSSLPPLNARQEEEIASEFQPRLLAYRLEKYRNVLNSTFEAAGMTAGVAEVARILGSCMVGEPVLQQAIAPLLQAQDVGLRVNRAFRPMSVVLEALLVRCCEDRHDAIRIGELTKLANGILEERGETVRLHPRRVGAIVKSLGIFAERNASGYSFSLSSAARQRVRELANAYDVPSARVPCEAGQGDVRSPQKADPCTM